MYLIKRMDFTKKFEGVDSFDNFFVINYENVLKASYEARKDKSYPVELDNSLLNLLEGYKEAFTEGKVEGKSISWNLTFDEGIKKYVVTEAKAVDR